MRFLKDLFTTNLIAIVRVARPVACPPFDSIFYEADHVPTGVWFRLLCIFGEFASWLNAQRNQPVS